MNPKCPKHRRELSLIAEARDGAWFECPSCQPWYYVAGKKPTIPKQDDGNHCHAGHHSICAMGKSCDCPCHNQGGVP